MGAGIYGFLNQEASHVVVGSSASDHMIKFYSIADKPKEGAL